MAQRYVISMQSFCAAHKKVLLTSFFLLFSVFSSFSTSFPLYAERLRRKFVSLWRRKAGNGAAGRRRTQRAGTLHMTEARQIRNTGKGGCPRARVEVRILRLLLSFFLFRSNSSLFLWQNKKPSIICTSPHQLRQPQIKEG